jgi:hypothetical protein
MARKRYNEEDILRLLREIEVHRWLPFILMATSTWTGLQNQQKKGIRP